MDRPSAWRKLPSLIERVDASPQVVRQIVQGIIGQARGDSAGHRYERLERVSPSESVMRFELQLFGREVTTVERVTATERGVRFELMEGYLAASEEQMEVAADGGGAVISYSGRYRPHAGRWSGLVQALLVPLIYRREVGRSLRAAKVMSETRRRRSPTVD